MDINSCNLVIFILLIDKKNDWFNRFATLDIFKNLLCIFFFKQTLLKSFLIFFQETEIPFLNKLKETKKSALISFLHPILQETTMNLLNAKYLFLGFP